MVIAFILGSISFVVVGMLWIISSLIHRPIFPYQGATGKQEEDDLAEEEAAVTAATWTILHPPS